MGAGAKLLPALAALDGAHAPLPPVVGVLGLDHDVPAPPAERGDDAQVGGSVLLGLASLGQLPATAARVLQLSEVPPLGWNEMSAESQLEFGTTAKQMEVD